MSLDRSPSDADWFRRLFDSHFEDLWRFALRRCESATDADDVTAQVFAVAWRRRAELPEPGTRLWLFGVARHVLANHRRSRNRHRLLQLRLVASHRLDHAISEVGNSLAEELRNALASLSNDDRDLVMMRCWDGLAVNEIATLLGCTPNAVSVRLHKARRKLGGQLTGQPGPDPRGHVSVDPQPRTEQRHDHQ